MSNSIVLKTTLTSGVTIREDEKTGMYDISEMFNSVNQMLGKNKESRRWLCQKSTQELIEYRNSLISNAGKNADIDNQQVTKSTCFKEIKGRKTKNGQTPNKLLGDPIIALDAAAYMDVSVKNDVYEYYLDGKINERRKVKENYKKFCSVLSRNLAKDRDVYEETCKKINGVVFGKFIGGLWNDDCTKEQYIEINDILVKLTTLIEDGDIENVPQLYKRLNRWFEKKWATEFHKCEVVDC